MKPSDKLLHRQIMITVENLSNDTRQAYPTTNDIVEGYHTTYGNTRRYAKDRILTELRRMAYRDELISWIEGYDKMGRTIRLWKVNKNQEYSLM